jgi:hypothetical protein
VAPGPHGKGGLIWAVQRSRVSRTGGQLLAGTPGSVLAGTQALKPRTIINLVGWVWIYSGSLLFLLGAAFLSYVLATNHIHTTPIKLFSTNITYLALGGFTVYFAIMLLRLRAWARVATQIVLGIYLIEHIIVGIQRSPWKMIHDIRFSMTDKIFSLCYFIISFLIYAAFILVWIYLLNLNSVKSEFISANSPFSHITIETELDFESSRERQFKPSPYSRFLPYAAIPLCLISSIILPFLTFFFNAFLPPTLTGLSIYGPQFLFGFGGVTKSGPTGSSHLFPNSTAFIFGICFWGLLSYGFGLLSNRWRKFLPFAPLVMIIATITLYLIFSWFGFSLQPDSL